MAVIDLHHGHELTDQLRVEDLWVGGHVSHTQLHEHVLAVRSDAQQSNHVRVDESCWLDGNLQSLIEEYAVIIDPRVCNRAVSAFRVLRCFAWVIEVVKERDGFILALSWPRILVTNRLWGRSCATAADVNFPLRPFSYICNQSQQTKIGNQ